MSREVRVGDRVTFERNPFSFGTRWSGTVTKIERAGTRDYSEPNRDLVYIRDDEQHGNWQRALDGTYGEVTLIEDQPQLKEKALSMSTHNALDLINAVRDLPPSDPSVTKRFADLILAAAGNDLTIEGDAVADIVNSWPNACDGGRNDFIRNNAIVRTPARTFTTINRFGSFVDNVDTWLWGQFNQGHSGELFGSNGCGIPMAYTFRERKDGQSLQQIGVANFVEVDMTALLPRITDTRVEVDDSGQVWVIVKTDQTWGDRQGAFWCMAFQIC